MITPDTLDRLTDKLAQELRRVDGDHSMGAGALAEALTPFIRAVISSQADWADQPAPIAQGGEAVPVAWSLDDLIYDDDGRAIGTDETRVEWGVECPNPDEGWCPLYDSPPAPSSSAVEELTRKWRESARGAKQYSTNEYETGCAAAESRCADELEQAIAATQHSLSALDVFRIAGGDTECNPDPTATNAMDCLRDLRACYDEALREIKRPLLAVTGEVENECGVPDYGEYEPHVHSASACAGYEAMVTGDADDMAEALSEIAAELSCSCTLDDILRSIDELRSAPPLAEQQEGKRAVEWLRERTRTCNTEASASIKRAGGQMTSYAESLTREGEIAWRYAVEIERMLAASIAKEI